MRDALNTARTRRYTIGQILTGKRTRTADDITAVAAFVAASSLTAITGATFGLFDSPTADDSCNITSGAATLTSPNNPWAAGDVGKAIDVQGAGAAGATLRSRIKAFGSAGSVTLWDNAGTTVAASSTSSGGLAIWGNDLNQTRALPVSPNEAGTSELSKASESVVPTGAPAGRSLAARFADDFNVKDFGALGDNTTDDTVAIQRAITAAVAATGHPSVVFPPGRYVVTAPLLNVGGIRLLGLGGQGSSEQVGVTLVVKHNGNAINFDPTTGTDFEGVGGGVENMEILKYTGFSGGDAIYVLGVSDARRPGEMIFRNVLIAAISTGLWARGLNFDGSALVTAGAKGIRTVLLEKVRVACCTTDNEYMLFDQCTHFYGVGVACDPATGTGVCGVTFKDECANMLFPALNISGAGNLILTAGLFTGFNAMGHFELNNGTTTATGTVSCDAVGPLTNKSKGLVVRSNAAPFFEAQLGAGAGNATGDGTVVTLLCDTNETDVDAGYDPLTGIFTAKMAGRYFFRGSVVVQSAGAAHVNGELSIVTTGKSIGRRWNPFVNVNPGTNSYMEVCGYADMAFGDTAKLQVLVSGGTKTVGTNVDTGIWATSFQGKYIG